MHELKAFLKTKTNLCWKNKNKNLELKKLKQKLFKEENASKVGMMPLKKNKALMPFP